MALQNSKIAIAERLMTRPQGATMDEILAETGGSFQYNAKRRLEARGYLIKTRREGRSLRYFAIPPEARSYEVTVTSKGQLTVPKEVRERLGLRAGGKLRLMHEAGDRVVMAPADISLKQLFGMLGKPPRSVSIEDMDEGIRRGAVERYLRSKR